jgi:hypothetical protein
MEDKDYTNIRIWQQTHRNLKIAAAYQGEKIVETLDRLVTEELRRIGVKTEDTKTGKSEQD